VGAARHFGGLEISTKKQTEEGRNKLAGRGDRTKKTVETLCGGVLWGLGGKTGEKSRGTEKRKGVVKYPFSMNKKKSKKGRSSTEGLPPKKKKGGDWTFEGTSSVQRHFGTKMMEIKKGKY